MRTALKLLMLLLLASPLFAQNASNARDFEEVVKNADDILWYFRVGDVASVDKVHLTSPKPERISNPTGQGAGNPMIIPAYVFTPKNLHGKAPLIVLIHGGVHGDFNTFYAHIVRELIDQGYVLERGKALTYCGLKVWKFTAGETIDFAHRPVTGFRPLDVVDGKLSADPY